MKGKLSSYNKGRYVVASLIPRISLSAKCLDIGCSEGIISEIVKQKGYEYYGLDLSKRILGNARHSLGNKIFIQGDANYFTL